MAILKRADSSATSQQEVLHGFSLTKRELDERTSVIAVEGELDLGTAPRLKWMLVEALEAGSTHLALDLSLVTFMDSTGLGVLVGVNRRLEGGARMAIVCTDENVLQVFRFSGTDSAFAIFKTLEEALAYARSEVASTG